MNAQLKKIALIGPESTGKTTLCNQLAEHYKTTWVPEFARDYVNGLHRKYNSNDVLHCAQQQIEEETIQSGKANHFLFCDTELITAKVWCEDVFKIVPEWIEKMTEVHHYDLYLLTFPDLPFENDPVRENPHRREFFFDWYERELIQYQFPYEIIKGFGEERLQNAIRAIEKHFKPGKVI